MQRAVPRKTSGQAPQQPWLNAAAADFEKSLEQDPSNSLTLDRLGLAYESNGEADQAIRAYTQEMALDSRLGKLRLADAYCVIGYERQLQKDFRAAVEAYRKSTDFGTADDKTCPVDPSGALVALKRNSERSEKRQSPSVERPPDQVRNLLRNTEPRHSGRYPKKIPS